MDPPENKSKGGLNFLLGFFVGILLFMYVVLIIMFSAYYQPQEFGVSYKEIFCGDLK